MAYIVDSSLINIDDLKDPEPGKLIRVRRPAWGQGRLVEHFEKMTDKHLEIYDMPVPIKPKEDPFKFKLSNETKTLSNEVRKKP